MHDSVKSSLTMLGFTETVRTEKSVLYAYVCKGKKKARIGVSIHDDGPRYFIFVSSVETGCYDNIEHLFERLAVELKRYAK